MQNYLTVENIELFVVTFLAICWAISMFLSARNGIRKAREESREPLNQLDQKIMALENKEQALEIRFIEIERQSGIYGDKMTLILRSQLSILSHLVNGNSVDKLRQSLQEINDYLVNR